MNTSKTLWIYLALSFAATSACNESSLSGSGNPGKDRFSASLKDKSSDSEDEGKDAGKGSDGSDGSDGMDGGYDVDGDAGADGASDTDGGGGNDNDGGQDTGGGADSSGSDVGGGADSSGSDVGGGDDASGGDDLTIDDGETNCSIQDVQVDSSLPAKLELLTPELVAYNDKIVSAVPFTLGNGVNPQNDSVTANKLCDILGYKSVDSTIGQRWKSPKDNTLVIWNGSAFITANGKTNNNWMGGLICSQPKTTKKKVCN